MNQLISLFPVVESTMTDLAHLNKSLNKVTLTGKINALDVASTLFEFTDATIQRFDELKDELGEALLEANLNKQLGELRSKAQIAIDILIRNLFERTADVGFLATDSIIQAFLTGGDIAPERMKKRLREYAAKYTVYNEIVIFDTEGNAKVNMNDANPIVASKDAIIADALHSDGYVERYAHSDIFAKQKRTLIYAQKIEVNRMAVGVLCLCFRLDDELGLILRNLGQANMEIAIADQNGAIASSRTDSKQFVRFASEDYQVIANKYLGVSTRTNGYQGFKGIETWYGYAKYIARETAVKRHDDALAEETGSRKTKLLDAKLSAIIEKANDLVEDLSDVIINGEIIASKRRAYVLSPILDNLRDISALLLASIKSSVFSLESLVESSLVHEVKMASNLAIDIMDRNLYERANDCRWWALTPRFQTELKQEEPNRNALQQTLLYINDLYTVYTNLFLYDKEGVIVAASNDQSAVGRRVDSNILANVNRNANTQNYYVSAFEQTVFYDERPTYLYNASVHNGAGNVGGIGIVFDSEIEFKAMLEDSFPLNKRGFSFFIDKTKRIIASTHERLKPLDSLEIDEELLKKAGEHSSHHYLTFEDAFYIVGVAKSKGYREYKREDNYSNDVYAVTFVRI